jgi:hypothetical protein
MVTSEQLSMVPQTTGFTLTIPAGSIQLTGVTTQNAASISFTNALEAGKRYTIRVLLVKTSYARFANSNIYWDGAKLTFDKYISPSHPDYALKVSEQQKQGVVFKWGSLIGISAAGTNGKKDTSWNPTAVMVYIPTTPGDPTTDHTAWESKTFNQQSAWSDYEAIPYVGSSDYTGPTNDRNNNYLTTLNLAGSYKGDICHYIDAAYRMPRSNEFPDAGWSNNTSLPPYQTDANHLPSDATGTTPIPLSDIKGTRGITLTIEPIVSGMFFPASGYRITDATLRYVGTVGCYWSSSAHSTDACNLGFDRGSLHPVEQHNRSFGCSVRCVLQ